MSFLLYCVLRSLPGPHPGLAGVNRERVLFITARGLSGAVSRAFTSDLVLNPSRIVAYESIISRLHCRCTVIPMRYGCVLEEEHRVVRFLEERREQFCALLMALDGCVEMGVRILPRREGEALEEHGSFRYRPVLSRHSTEPGRDYLAAQRLHYEQSESVYAEHTAVIEKVLAAFSGLFIKSKEEDRSTAQVALWCSPHCFLFYFLIRAGSVEEFRNRFQQNRRRGFRAPADRPVGSL